MTRLLLAALALGASVVQLGVAPALDPDGSALPLLPVALLAAWGVMRGPSEATTAILATAIPMAIASEERLGWYLLALVPAGVALLAAPARELPAQRFARVPVVAALGALGYLALLSIAGGRARALVDAAPWLALTAATTAGLALPIAAALWPFRGRPRGLFG